MANNAPQFSPMGGVGSIYGDFTYTQNGWVQNPPAAPAGGGGGYNPGIVSTTSYRSDLDGAQNTLNDFSNDPYMKLFKELKLKNQQAEETARLNAEADANRAKVQQEQNYMGRKAATESSNIVGGLSRYAPELASSQTQQVYIANLAKVEAIQGEEDLAIARAKEARAKNDLEVMRDELDYIQELRKAKAEALSEANKMAFEREKFNEDIRQFNTTNARLSGSGSGVSYTDQELKKLREAGIDPKNITMSDNYLYGENKGIIPPIFSNKNIAQFGGVPKLWKLALALGIPRNKNLSKQDEVAALFNNQELVEYVQEMTNNGITIDEIIASQ